MNRSDFIRISLAVAPLLLPSSWAYAAGQQTGAILDLRVSSPTLANPTHIQIDGTYQNRPACAISGFWAIDSDTATGKSFLATIMLAKATGKPITFAGSGTCSLRSDMETIVQMQVVQ